MTIAPALAVSHGLLIMTHVTATGSIAVSDISYFYNLIAAAGVAGVWVMAFLFDWVVTRKAYQKSEDEAAMWRSNYEHERDAHQATREALQIAVQRTEAGVEAAKMATMLVEALRSRSGRGSDD